MVESWRILSGGNGTCNEMRSYMCNTMLTHVVDVATNPMVFFFTRVVAGMHDFSVCDVEHGAHLQCKTRVREAVDIACAEVCTAIFGVVRFKNV